MGIIQRLLGIVPASEREGIHLTDPTPRRLTPVREPTRFLRALLRLGLTQSTLYIEGTAYSAVREFLQRNSTTPTVRVALGTIWPKPDVWHLPLNETTINGLIVVLENNKVAYFCAHIHVYRESTVFLEWHDAFGDDPMLLSTQITDTQAREFVAALGTTTGNAG